MHTCWVLHAPGLAGDDGPPRPSLSYATAMPGPVSTRWTPFPRRPARTAYRPQTAPAALPESMAGHFSQSLVLTWNLLHPGCFSSIIHRRLPNASNFRRCGVCSLGISCFCTDPRLQHRFAACSFWRRSRGWQPVASRNGCRFGQSRGRRRFNANGSGRALPKSCEGHRRHHYLRWYSRPG
jgi:hypothetical protein